MKEYQDFYFRKAKAEKYPARSVYKLKEIDGKYHILGAGLKILDLGAAPGSWSLACAEKTGADGHVLACDIRPCATAFPPQVRFLQTDVFNRSPDFDAALKSLAPFDVVLSDMAPATTGSKFTDQARSCELVNAAFDLACACLRHGGSFVAKIFMGPDVQALLKILNQRFARARTFKPTSSRSESKETFLICLQFLGNEN